MGRQFVLLVCAAALAAATLAGCGHGGAGESVPPSPPAGAPPVVVGYARDLIPADFHDYLLSHGDVFVLDVRMPGEWDGDLGHLDRAVVIPAQELEQRLSELPQDRHQPIAVYCRLGLLAPQAGRLLAQRGYREVVTLVGGLAAYRRAGF